MKFFLVISIIALWCVPVNSPGNIGISNLPLKIEPFPKDINHLPDNRAETTLAKRKRDHFGRRARKRILKNKIK